MLRHCPQSRSFFLRSAVAALCVGAPLVVLSGAAEVARERPVADLTRPAQRHTATVIFSHTSDPAARQPEADAIMLRGLFSHSYWLTADTALARVFDSPEVLQTAWARQFDEIGKVEHAAALADLRTRVQSRVIEGTRYVALDVTMDDPAEAVLIANRIATQYMEDHRSSHNSSVSTERERLWTLIKDRENELRSAGRRRESLAQSTRLASTDPTRDPVHSELALLLSKKLDIELEIAAQVEPPPPAPPDAHAPAPADPGAVPAAPADRKLAFIDKRINELEHRAEDIFAAANRLAGVDRTILALEERIAALRTDLDHLTLSSDQTDIRIVEPASLRGVRPAVPK